MPQVKRVASLFDMCINYISVNMDKWSLVTTPNDTNINSDLSGGIFNELSTGILDDLMCTVTMVRKERSAHYCEMLVTQHLRELHPSCWHLKKTEIDHLLHLASIRCPELQCICFHSNSDNFEDYLHLLPKFEKLTTLNFCQSQVGDPFLKAVGSSCPNLRALDVSGCISVTDVGIESLCVSYDDVGRENERPPCEFLQELIFRKSGVTKKGIQMALKKLPALKICSGATAQLISEIRQTDAPDKRYALIALSVTPDSTLYKSGNLAEALSICPFITKVDIFVKVAIDPNLRQLYDSTAGFTDTELLSLTALENLSILSIDAQTHRLGAAPISFGGGVEPVLKVIGKSIQTLFLGGISGVNVELIAKHCNSLRSLKLRWERKRRVRSNAPEETHGGLKRLEMQNQILFRDLEIMRLLGPVPSEYLRFLLSSPSLEVVHMSDCSTVTDDLLKNVAECHDFVHLKYLMLTNCKNVSGRGVECFMQDSNPMFYLDLKGCSVSSNDIDIFKQKAIDNHWHLRVVSDSDVIHE